MLLNDEAKLRQYAAALPNPARESARTARLHGTVLVVDDSGNGRKVIERVLVCMGLDVSTTENGFIACEQAIAAQGAGQPFDLILMDMQMPVMDGFAATTHLRELGYLGRIVAFTANTDPGTREQCLYVGCNDYAAKPISFEMLFDVVVRNLQASGFTVKSARTGSAISAL